MTSLMGRIAEARLQPLFGAALLSCVKEGHAYDQSFFIPDDDVIICKLGIIGNWHSIQYVYEDFESRRCSISAPLTDSKA
jgi:hypothetical protein